MYAALATPEGVAGWWTTDTTGDRDVGGILRTVFHADGKELGAFDLRIVDLQPLRRVAWALASGPPEWMGTTIAFELKQEGNFTIVLFRHEGWREPVEFLYHCSTKWAVFLLSLKSRVETGRGRPSPDDVRISNWH